MNADFFSERALNSRRDRPCSICGALISAGSTYVCVKACSSGRYWSQWNHVDCYRSATGSRLQLAEAPTAALAQEIS